jgi:hypothetical protein
MADLLRVRASAYMMGELFKQSDTYPGGLGFNNPFEKGARSHGFDPGLKFPKPNDELWDNMIAIINRKSNTLSTFSLLWRRNAIRAAALNELARTKQVRDDEDERDVQPRRESPACGA